MFFPAGIFYRALRSIGQKVLAILYLEFPLAFSPGNILRWQHPETQSQPVCACVCCAHPSTGNWFSSRSALLPSLSLSLTPFCAPPSSSSRIYLRCSIPPAPARFLQVQQGLPWSVQWRSKYRYRCECEEEQNNSINAKEREGEIKFATQIAPWSID